MNLSLSFSCLLNALYTQQIPQWSLSVPKKKKKKGKQDGSCPWCAQLSQIIWAQIPQATNRFLTNRFMSSFHAEILSAPHIPVKEISIHSHVPAMTHISLEQKQALGSLEKKKKKSHSRLPWFATSLRLPGLWSVASQRSSRETATEKYPPQNKWCSSYYSSYYYRRVARAKVVKTLMLQCSLDSFNARNQQNNLMSQWERSEQARLKQRRESVGRDGAMANLTFKGLAVGIMKRAL